MKKKIIVAICGASGGIYGLQLVRALLSRPTEVFLTVSRAGERVLQHELEYADESFESFLKREEAGFHKDAELNVYAPDDLFAPPASGSFRHDGMVVAPCSMKTLGAVASGMAETLITRAADVSLKEKRSLILVPRETPLSAIHLKNMYQLSIAGAVIMPPCPSFYFHPETVTDLVDTIVARILDHLGITHKLIAQWGQT